MESRLEMTSYKKSIRTAIQLYYSYVLRVIIITINSTLIITMSDLTLYFLQASRSIRIAWLLEELGLDYKLETYDREETGLAPARFKQSCGTGLGKAPVLKDGRLTLQESGAITEYVCPSSAFNSPSSLFQRSTPFDRS